MNLLKIFLKHPQLINLSGYEKDVATGEEWRLRPKTKKEILELIQEARYVMIEGDLILEASDEISHPTMKTVSDLSDIFKDHQPLMTNRKQRSAHSSDLLGRPIVPPFELTWFEVYNSSNGGKTIPMMFFDTVMGSGKKVPLASVGMLVHQTGPGLYDIFSLEAGQGERNPENIGWNISIMRNVQSSYDPRADLLCQISLRGWLRAIELGAMGMENTDETVFLPRGEGNKGKVKPHHIRQIVRIVPKKMKARIAPVTPKGQIDWSHRWEVRGHWRKVDGIGKDPEGMYIVEGWTWVNDFVKGPEELPIVKKLRLVSGGN
jgi:hypothetical protein